MGCGVRLRRRCHPPHYLPLHWRRIGLTGKLVVSVPVTSVILGIRMYLELEHWYQIVEILVSLLPVGSWKNKLLQYHSDARYH